MKRFTRFLSLLGLALVSLGPVATAQLCVGPDGLDGPCCDIVTETLPTFPNISLDGSALTWQACDPLPKFSVALQISAPIQIACGSYVSDLFVSNAAGDSHMSGALELAYSRTWTETDPAGDDYQVWRFLVMGDFDPGIAPSPPGLLPADPVSFYHGYIDYVRPCTLGPWQHAVVLFHNCDRFLHLPFFSSTPGVFNPDRTFAFVGPDNALQPFDHTGIVPPIMGAPLRGGLRDPGPAGSGECFVRDPVGQGSLNVLVEGCACPLSLTLPPRNAATQLSAFGNCGGGAISIDVNNSTASWLHLVSTSLGRWTDPLSYPGTEAALVYEGPILWREACTLQSYVELHYGAGTRGGWMRTLPAPFVGPAQSAFDIRSNWSFPLPGPLGFPIVGAVLPDAMRRHSLYLDAP